MGIPKFHVVKGNEFGLSGIANPDPGVGRYGYEWGSMHRPIQSMSVDDCAILTGEVKLPEGHIGTTFNAEFLQFDLTIINIGEDITLPTPEEASDLFVTWPCSNPNGKKQLKDLVIVTFTDVNSVVVKEQRLPGLFHGDTFFPTNSVYFVNNRYPWAGQRIQMNDVKDGTYKIEIKVNPDYGECVPAVVWVMFTGQDIKIVEAPVIEPPKDEIFPAGLVWEKFAE